MSTNMSQSKATTYTEHILMLNGFDALSASEQSAIDCALMNNSAVGIVAGAYDDVRTVAMASNIFFENLGYTTGDFPENANTSLLDFVYEEDRDFFTSPEFVKFEGAFEFRALAKDGGQEYVHAYKTESEDAQGNPQWVFSARVSKDSVAMNQLFNSISRLVVRFAVCDLQSGTYDFYDCGNGKLYPAHGRTSNLLRKLGSTRKMLVDDQDLGSALSNETLRKYLKTPEDVYGFDYASKDESKYYRMNIIPLDFKDGQLIRVLAGVMDVTKARKSEMRAQAALKEAYHAANKANAAKTQFLSNMSHDIRTPMNAIIGMTAIASAHVDDRDRVLDALGKITTSSRHLLGLINEVLDMSRIERGKLSLSIEDFSLPELVDNMIEMVRPSIIERKQNFDVRIQDIEHENVVGDSLRIQQVFTNVMGNAVKYTPEGGSILLAISEKPTQNAGVGCYEFVVQDTGVGMSKDFVDHIFEPFTRADSADRDGIQGTGLGMTIAKNIVDMMNGSIKVDSELGKGTKVTITIFLKLQEDIAADDEALANLPVLVVDDDEVSCESTVDTLESIGMQGEWVNNGHAAVERVTETHEAKNDFYAVILDWKMPGMDGIETARAIRAVVGPDIPIIMLTAYDFGNIEEEARAAGVNCFVTKPLFRSRLKSVFKSLAAGADAKVSGEAAVTDQLPIGDYSGKRVLLVEDNMLNREIMAEILSETNIDIETAVNGKIAVDMVAEHPEGYYDLVFMDIQMPVMNGYEATIAIRALPDGKGATLPIVALTANAFAEDVVMAKNAGVNEHLSKPVNVERIAEAMQTWIK